MTRVKKNTCIINEVHLWVCLCRCVQRHTLNMLAHSMGWRLRQYKKEKVSWAPGDFFLYSLTLDVLWPATSCAHCHVLSILMDCILSNAKSKQNSFVIEYSLQQWKKCLIYHQDLKTNYRSSEMVWWVIHFNKSNDLSSILRTYMVGKNRLSKVFLWPPHMSHAICPPNQYNF